MLSLPVIKYFGGGELLIHPEKYTRQLLTPEAFAPLVPLLRQQTYITDVRPWQGERVDLNLNDFRPPMFAALRKDVNSAKGVGLWQWYARTFGVPESEWQAPWLTVDSLPGESWPVIVNRSPRYHNPRFPWHNVLRKYRGCAQIGLPEEQIVFVDSECDANGVQQMTVAPFVETPNLLEAAKLIQSAKLFVGNQSACLAICEGLKKPCVVEVYPQMPNCLFHREHCWHGFNENVFLPDLGDLP